MKTEEATMEKEKQPGQAAGDSGSRWDNLLPLRYAADIVDPDTIQKRMMTMIGGGRRIAGVEIQPTYFQVGNPATDEGQMPARPDNPVEDRLVLRENAKSEEEGSHVEPAGPAPMAGNVDDADRRKLTRYELLQLESRDRGSEKLPEMKAPPFQQYGNQDKVLRYLSPDRFREIEVRAGRPIMLDGHAGPLPVELSPDGLTFEERESQIWQEMEKASKQRAFTNPSGMYAPDWTVTPRLYGLQRNDAIHHANIARWRANMVPLKDVVPGIIGQIGMEKQAIYRTLDNDRFRESPQARGLDFSRPGYQEDPAFQKAAEEFLAAQPETATYWKDKVGRTTLGGLSVVTDAVGGLGVVADSAGLPGVGESLKGVAEGADYLQEDMTDRRQDGYISSGVAEGIGQMAAMVALSYGAGALVRSLGAGERMVAVTEGVTGAGFGAGANGWNVYREAKALGADEVMARKAGLVAVLAGTADIIPLGKIVSRVGRVEGMRITGKLLNVLNEVAEQGVKAGGQQGLNNLIAERYYDANRELFDEVVEVSGGSVTPALVISVLSVAAARGWHVREEQLRKRWQVGAPAESSTVSREASPGAAPPTESKGNLRAKTEHTGEDIPAAASKAGQKQGGVSREQAKQWVDEVLRKWGSKLDVTVHESAEAIPDAALRDRVLGEGDVEGFYFGADRRVHVLADQIRSRERIEPLLKHEGLHWAVAGPLKAEYENLREWVRENIPADELERLRRNYSEEVVVEEYLAHLAETNPRSAIWKRFVYEFRKLLRRVLGDHVEFTEEDLRAFVGKAQRRVERAKSASGSSQAEQVGGRDFRANDDIRFSVEKSTMPHQVKSLGEAIELAKNLVGKEINNADTGMPASISGNSLRKMTSESAVKKSEDIGAHILAVANVDRLFENAALIESHADRSNDRNIEAIHRFYAPMISKDEVLAVKITVKELVHPAQNRIYSVEAIDVEKVKPAGLLAHGSSDAQTSDAPLTGFKDKLHELALKIKDSK